MIVRFNGNCPNPKYVRLGVGGNNLVDIMTMIVDFEQEDVNLETYTPYLKMCTKDFSFCDRTSAFQVAKEEGAWKITYIAPDKITVKRNLDMQLTFEKFENGEILRWQTRVFNVTFDFFLDVSEEIGDDYPDVLKELEERIEKAREEAEAKIQSEKNKYFFPNIGRKSVIYIDEEENKSYRYDEIKHKYYVIGSDYQDIKIINCNGGQEE